MVKKGLLGKGDAQSLYNFHQASIHEDRFLARLCRAVPLCVLLMVITMLVCGVVWSPLLLLSLCAAMNVVFWLWVVGIGLFSMWGASLVTAELDKHEAAKRPRPVLPNTGAGTAAVSSSQAAPEVNDGVVHLIILPNYNEPEPLLEETLQSLVEAEDSCRFRVVLAMEGREAGAEAKAERLKERFKAHFGDMSATYHPSDLVQDHLDGYSNLEVPGKASNLKYAVRTVFDRVKAEESERIQNVVLTIADSDCLFHPSYFAYISRDFNTLREHPGDEHKWTMWQAPQLSFREHYNAPMCSRVWTYCSAMYEFGGTTTLRYGGQHMVFSGYSLPLQLAASAQSWDGDVIAEDHHAYLKTFFYAIHQSATQCLQEDASASRGCQCLLKVRPVFLPVKSTSVISKEGWWTSWVARWHQAKRHSQGVAELSYALLATWDMLCTLPFRACSWNLCWSLIKVFFQLCCMHLLPVCQGLGFAVMTTWWLGYGRHQEVCPDRVWVADLSRSKYLLCGLAGAWALTWPVIVPIVVVVISNYCFVRSAFLRKRLKEQDATSDPAQLTVWDSEDGSFPGYEEWKGPSCLGRLCEWCCCCCTCCCRSSSSLGASLERWTPLLLIGWDALWISFLLVPYGFIAMVLAYCHVCIYGNNINYITALKPVKERPKYGAMA